MAKNGEECGLDDEAVEELLVKSGRPVGLGFSDV